MKGGIGISAVFIAVALLGTVVGAMPPHVTGDLGATSSAKVRPVPSRRVAVMAPVLTSYVAIDGGIGHVSAVSDFTRRIETRGLFGNIFPQISSLPVLGTTGAVPDPELTLRFNPDAVIAWRTQSDSLRTTGYLGIVELEGFPADYGKIWTVLERVAGQEARGARLRRDAETRQNNLDAMLSPGKLLKVLPMSLWNDKFWFGTRGYFLNALIQRVGGINPASDINLYGSASAEEILLFDPDVIIIPSTNGIDDISAILDNSMLQTLQAVRNRQVYLMPPISAFNGPVDQTLALTWLAELLHPSLPAMTRAAYRDIYAQAYGCILTADDIDAALLIAANQTSTGYDRFLRSPEGR